MILLNMCLKTKVEILYIVKLRFSYIINNIQGQQNINGNSIIDITPLDAYNMIEKTF